MINVRQSLGLFSAALASALLFSGAPVVAQPLDAPASGTMDPAPAQEGAASQTVVDPGTPVVPKDYRFELGVTGGGHFFYIPHGLGRDTSQDRRLSPKHNLIYGIRLGVLITRWLSFETDAMATLTSTRREDFDFWVFQLGGQLVLHPWTGPVQPFILLGYGAMSNVIETEKLPPVDPDDPNSENDRLTDDQDGMVRAGAGVKFNFSERVGFRLEARILTNTAFAADVLPLGDETGYGGPDWQALASLYVRLGQIKPKVVVQEKVVQAPAPPDRDPDRDGIADPTDKCPTVAEDKDGFEDEDGCPESDNDKDGIPDATDKCPNEPETMNGIDDEDGCPETDPDGDGIFGTRDQCPNEPETRNGFKDMDGCPDEIPADLKKFTGVIQGINFKTASHQLLRNSYPLLDRAVAVLQQYPEIRLEIQGHTDSRGKADYNRDLSQRRADSVREYLTGKGIAADRLTAVGYGLDRPIASNKTKTGRSKNRRTEFQIILGNQPVPAGTPIPAGTVPKVPVAPEPPTQPQPPRQP